MKRKTFWPPGRFRRAAALTKIQPETIRVCGHVLIDGATVVDACRKEGLVFTEAVRVKVQKALARLREVDRTALPPGWREVTLRLPPEMLESDGLRNCNDIAMIRHKAHIALRRDER